MNHAKIREKTAPPLIFNTTAGAALTFVNEICGGIMYNILRFSNIMISPRSFPPLRTDFLESNTYHCIERGEFYDLYQLRRTNS